MPGNFLQVVPTASQQTMTVNSRESRYHSSNLVHEIPYVRDLLSHVDQMRGQLNYVMQAMQNCVATGPQALASGQTSEAALTATSTNDTGASTNGPPAREH